MNRNGVNVSSTLIKDESKSGFILNRMSNAPH